MPSLALAIVASLAPSAPSAHAQATGSLTVDRERARPIAPWTPATSRCAPPARRRAAGAASACRSRPATPRRCAAPGRSCSGAASAPSRSASPRLELGANPRVTALFAGRRSTLLTLAVAPNTTASGVSARGDRARRSPPPRRKAIARRLRVAKLPRTGFATVAATATFARAAAARRRRARRRAGRPRRPAPRPRPDQASRRSKPGLRERRTITSATVTWRVRESFIQYIASGEGTATSRGATGDPPEVAGGSQAPLVYAFHFPFAGGWCDPATGSARLTLHRHRGFALRRSRDRPARQRPRGRTRRPGVARDLPHERAPASTDGGNQRAVVETLDVSKAAGVPRAPTRKSFDLSSGPRRSSRRARPTRCSPATTSQATRSGGSPSPSPLPESRERTRTHAQDSRSPSPPPPCWPRRPRPRPPTTPSRAASSTGRSPTR